MRGRDVFASTDAALALSVALLILTCCVPCASWGQVPGGLLRDLYIKAMGRSEGIQEMNDGDMPKSIHHLAVGSDGLIYVSNFVHNEVYRGRENEFGIWKWWRVVNKYEGTDGPTGLTFGEDSHLLVASFGTDQIMRYDAQTGNLMDIFVNDDEGMLDCPEGLLVAQGRLLVASFLNDRIVSYNATNGKFLEVFSGGWHLDGPQVMLSLPRSSSILVSSYHRDKIVVLDASTGKKLSEFGGAELKRPVGLVAAPFSQEILCVSHVTNEILRYNGTSGILRGVFASGYGLWAPTGMALRKDMMLFVATFADGVRRYSYWQ